jgi:hypothetical protein
MNKTEVAINRLLFFFVLPHMLYVVISGQKFNIQNIWVIANA